MVSTPPNVCAILGASEGGLRRRARSVWVGVCRWGGVGISAAPGSAGTASNCASDSGPSGSGSCAITPSFAW